MRYLYEISVDGRVQGVGYRYFVKARASELNLKGFVRNSYDGRVHIEAEGERDDLEIFLETLRKGPALARVDRMEVSKAPCRDAYYSFEIRY